MKCQTCGKGPLDGVRTDMYHGADGVHVLCDPCLFAEMPRADQPATAVTPISEALDEELRLHGIAALAEYA